MIEILLDLIIDEMKRVRYRKEFKNNFMYSFRICYIIL